MLKKVFSGKSGVKNDKMNPVNKGKAEEILAEYMLKRSVNKSTLFSNENYKERWFVLDNDNLKYFDGSLGVSCLVHVWWCQGLFCNFGKGSKGLSDWEN